MIKNVFKITAILMCTILFSLSICTTVLAASESEENNLIYDSNPIEFDEKVEGTIEKDDVDYYKISLENSGHINFRFNSFMQYYCFYIFDNNEKQIYKSESNIWDKNTQQRNDLINVYLEKGTYYVKITGYYNGTYSPSVGDYNFKATFTSSKATYDEPNNTFDDATPISLNKKTNGVIALDDPYDFFQIKLATAGRINLTFTSFLENYCIYIYDNNEKLVYKKESLTWDKNTKQRVDKYKLDLGKGTYKIKVTGYYTNNYSLEYGFYNFTPSFTSAGENYKEPNNTIDDASPITLGKNLKGQIALNDVYDCYKINLSKAGRISFNLKAYMEHYSFYLYDKNEKLMYKKESVSWDKDTEQSSTKYSFDLGKGTYYIKITGYYSNTYSLTTGNYNFTPSFKSASETLPEPNNTLNTAKTIGKNKNIKGQIALNDVYDFYKYKTNSSSMKIKVTSYLPHYSIYVYNSSGTVVFKQESIMWDKNVNKDVTTHTIKGLRRGSTYRIKISGYYSNDYSLSTGNYNFIIS